MRNVLHAIRPLANDLLSSIVFALMAAMGFDLLAATGVAITLGVGQVVLTLARRRPVAPLQWASLGLVLTLGTVSLYLRDPRFLMAKPTVIYLILGTMMLKRGWMVRYLPPIAEGHGDQLAIRFGYVWAGLMGVTAVANLLMAIFLPTQWPAFMAVFPMASKLGLFGVQYLTIRAVVRPRVIAALAAQESTAVAR